MDSQHEQQFEQIVVLSRDMLCQARENGWERVAELEQRRRTLVERCFPLAPATGGPRIAALIREILSINQEVTELVQKHRQALGENIQTRKVGRSAQAAYLRCAR